MMMVAAWRWAADLGPAFAMGALDPMTDGGQMFAGFDQMMFTRMWERAVTAIEVTARRAAR